MPVVRGDFAVGRTEVIGRSIGELRGLAPLETHRGVCISGVRRLGHAAPALPGFACHCARGRVLALGAAVWLVRLAARRLGGFPSFGGQNSQGRG
jgi:hypothetical protein